MTNLCDTEKASNIQSNNLNNWNSRNSILRLALGMAGLIVFAFLAWKALEAGKGPVLFDNKIRFWFYDGRREWLTPLVKAITYSGNWQPTVAVALLLVVIPKTRKPLGYPSCAMAIISVSVYSLLKIIFDRPRPDKALWLVIQHDASFPSGHALNCMIFYGAIILLIYRGIYPTRHRKSIPIILFLLILTIGLSRIYVGVHYPTDVVAGWGFGIFLLMIFSFWVDKYGKHLKPNEEKVPRKEK